MSRILKAAITTLLVTTLALVVLVILLPTALGLQRYVITGGSMDGTFPKGSIVYSRLTAVSALEVGDVITFVPPDSTSQVTHRIVAISKAEDGQRVFQTKGDANQAVDPWRITFPQTEQARYVAHIPSLGYALAALSLRWVRLLAIAVPAVVVALSLLWSLWRDAGREAARETAARALPQAAIDPLETE